VKAADGVARTMQLYVESCFEDFYTHTITCINEKGERVRPLPQTLPSAYCYIVMIEGLFMWELFMSDRPLVMCQFDLIPLQVPIFVKESYVHHVPLLNRPFFKVQYSAVQYSTARDSHGTPQYRYVWAML